MRFIVFIILSICLTSPFFANAQELPIDKTKSPKLFEAQAFANKYSNQIVPPEIMVQIEQKFVDAYNSKEEYSGYYLGRYYVSIKKNEVAIPLFEKEYLSGNNYAAIPFAYNLQKIEPYNCDKAREYLIKAEENGIEKAQEFLGDFFDNGKCGITDPRKAYEYYKKAADRGIKGAQYMVGAFHLYGWTGEKDYIKAHAWLNICNKNKNRPQHIIFNMYDVEAATKMSNLHLKSIIMGKSKSEKLQKEICATTKACEGF